MFIAQYIAHRRVCYLSRLRVGEFRSFLYYGSSRFLPLPLQLLAIVTSSYSGLKEAYLLETRFEVIPNSDEDSHN